LGDEKEAEKITYFLEVKFFRIRVGQFGAKRIVLLLAKMHIKAIQLTFVEPKKLWISNISD
jgi:hypothetical protein